MAGPLSYLLCGTPRTGSTLLCGLLTSTGVAGRPESYFRQPDEHAWARRLGVPVAGDGSFDYRWFVRAVRVAGSTPNGVFAARVMWGTMQRIVDGLDASPPRRDLDVLVDAFGPLRMVHLRRDDGVGQAVSWARAEQTGYWQEGDRSSARARFDFGQVADLVRTIREHNAAWSTWFAEQGVEPHSVTYEEVTGNPGRQSTRSSSTSASSCPRPGDPQRGSAGRPMRSTPTGSGATAQHNGGARTQTAWTATQVVRSCTDGCRSYCRTRTWRFVVEYGSHESQVRADSRADTFGGCPGSWFVVPRRI